ncbi:MAG: glycoside hydrolase family 31 protein [Pirellulales bacterium]|nr:glycoside hydrolase family 31 protein [Pirellulales bacterium]
MYLRFFTAGLFLVICLFPSHGESATAAGQRCTRVAPGVWRVRFGQPEELTPIKFQEHPPRLEAMEKLQPVGKIPIDPADIGFSTSGRGAALKVPMTENERFYGLGMNLRVFRLKGKKIVRVSDNQTTDLGDSHAPAPIYVSSRGYGVLVDTARCASFYFGNLSANRDSAADEKESRDRKIADGVEELYRPRGPGSMFVGVDVPAARGVDLFIFAGPDLRQAVQRYNLFSGGGFVPPMWGLGVWYRASAKLDQASVMNFLREFRERHIPCDVFGLEPGWHSGCYPCTFAWSKMFPDPDGLLGETKQLGYKLNLWEHAFTRGDSPLYKPLLSWSGDFKVWGGLTPDFATAEGRKIFSDYHAKNFVDKGVSGFKLDECDHQPLSSTPWSFPEHSRFPSGLDGEQMHLLFGPLYQRTISSIYRDRNQRTFGLVRSSGPLAAPLPFALYSDAYDHRDYVRAIATSGFAGVLWCPEIRAAGSVEELYRRLQTSVFSAVTQVDCWFLKNPVWKQINKELNNEDKFMDDWQRTEAVCRNLLELRMSLLPYLYSAYADYHNSGVPPTRALVMDYPDDPAVADLDDQYMFGPSLMVAPLFAGEKQRTVYLPKGDWYDFWTGEKHVGGRKIEVSKPVDQIPVFVKGGTLLPLAKPVEYVSLDTCFDIEVRVFGSAPKSFVLYEDDGTTFDFEKGRQNLWELSWDGKSGSVRKTSRFDGPTRYKIVGWKRAGEQ